MAEPNNYGLSIDDASKLLANVFDACQQPPNTIPLAKLESYSEYRRERYSLQKTLLILFLLAFLLMPLCFICPELSVESASASYNPKYIVQVGNSMPVKTISAVMDGHSIAVYEVADHRYEIEPAVNGQMEIKVTLINNQWISKTVDVKSVDRDAPHLIKSTSSNKSFTLHLEDSGLGIDYPSIYAVGISGQKYYPESYDESSGTVVFERQSEDLQVYIYDVNNNCLMLYVTVSKNK